MFVLMKVRKLYIINDNNIILNKQYTYFAFFIVHGIDGIDSGVGSNKKVGGRRRIGWGRRPLLLAGGSGGMLPQKILRFLGISYQMLSEAFWGLKFELCN